MSNFMKIQPVGNELILAGDRGQTNVTKLTVAHPNFGKVPRYCHPAYSTFTLKSCDALVTTLNRSLRWLPLLLELVYFN